MRYGLIGASLSHSFSPQIHAAFGNKEYFLRELSASELPLFMKERAFAAVNVTIPYKQAVMPLCDYISPEAQQIGSVNTVINQNGLLCGYNTDYFGFAYLAAQAAVDFDGKKVLVLGSGGTSLAAQAAALDSGAREICVVSRSGADNYQNLHRHYDAEILINTTPLGMYPQSAQSPLDIAPFTHLDGVIDVIYNPLRTALLLQAKEKGIAYAGGLSMLVGQAKKAHELFFKTTLDEDLIKKVVKQLEEQMANVVLIGMPGSGKTTVGSLLAQKLGFSFVDVDQAVEQAAGMTVTQIFQTHGEPFFRHLEHQTIKRICAQGGQVIATGGGSVLNSESRQYLSQNGLIIWLDRETDKLDRCGRPLSGSTEELTLMYATRVPLYQKLSDIKVHVTDDAAETVRIIMEQRACCLMTIKKAAADTRLKE